MKERRLSPCQDCGCNGSMIMVLANLNNEHMMACPFCGRKSKPVPITLDVEKDTMALIDAWESANPAFEGGLI